MKRVYSIKSQTDIDLVFKEKKSVGNKYFAIYIKYHLLPHFKYALSIGKKYGNAVERNQAKRRIRYIISQNQKMIKSNKSFVIVVKPSVNELKYKEIESNLIKLLIKADILKKEETPNA
ncbi:ribonuclease P protein component [Acholeplasma granularum]|uniref:ribonuclease P protein component n=1 Tax=Acholeplasma granularum TaxID=264635 RepID=UPI00046E6035|nr:ribonuclease P protein component [Acholeplasma granularum]